MKNTISMHLGSISILNTLELYINHVYMENSAGNNSCIYLYNVNDANIDELIVRNSKNYAGLYVKDPVNLSLKNIEIHDSEGDITGGIHIVSENSIDSIELINIYVENTSGDQYSAGIYIKSYVNQINAINITMKDMFGHNYGGLVCKGCINAHLENINILNARSEKTAGIHFTETHIFVLNNSNFDTVNSESSTGCLHLEILNNLNPSVMIENSEFLQCIGIDGAINLSKNPSYIVQFSIKNTNFISGIGKSGASSLKISEWHHLSDNSVIENCNFSDNYSSGLQGIINLRYLGFMTILKSIFQNNIIDSGSIISGFFKTSEKILMINDSRFINNSAKIIIDIFSLLDGLIIKTENLEFTRNNGILINLSKVI